VSRRPSRSAQIEMTKTVEAYLAYVNGRTSGARSKEWYQQRIEALRAKMTTDGVSQVSKLRMLQQVRDFERKASDAEDPTQEFVAIAGTYSDLHRIEYETWREMGVPARVLKEAGW